MGFFNFKKEGPGVSKDGPKKKGIFLFFELFGRKIGKFCEINMLYFLVSIPMILVSFIAANFFVNYMANILNVTVDKAALLPWYLLAAFLFVLFIGSGPASASLAYFNQCVVKEKGIYLVSDFFEQFKKNFKQGIIVGIINPLLSFAMLFCALFYGVQYMVTGSMLWFFCMIVLIAVGLIFVSSGFYIYQLMITFENSTLELYKNSIILALINLPVNLIFIILLFIISDLIFTTFHAAITIVLSFICLISVMRFIIEFYTSRVIEKKIINNIKKED